MMSEGKKNLPWAHTSGGGVAEGWDWDVGVDIGSVVLRASICLTEWEVNYNQVVTPEIGPNPDLWVLNNTVIQMLKTVQRFN